MKLLPLYVNCLLNCDALAGGSDMMVDDRTYNMFAVQTKWTWPLVYRICSLVCFPFTKLWELDSDELRDDGIYILDNGLHLFLWIGQNVRRDWIHSLFGVMTAGQSLADRSSLPELDNPVSQQVANFLVNFVRNGRAFTFLSSCR